MTPAVQIQTRFVRKLLDEDCLLRGELHPSIAERLNRVRELPVQTVANLYGVDRDKRGVWLVWQFVEGCTFDEYRAQGHSSEELARVIREVRLALAAMHVHGLVHGAVHERNIIIEPTGRVRLTHVSPLLYDDARLDFVSLNRIAGAIAPAKSEDEIHLETTQHEDERLRIRAYAAAAAWLLVGIIIFALILWYIRV